jgi:trigger factor
MESVEDVKKNIKDSLEGDKRKDAENEIKEKIIDAILEKNKFEIPEALIQFEFDTLMRNLRIAGQMDDEAIKKAFWPAAERMAMKDVLLEKIARQEKLEATEDEIEEEFEKALAETKGDRSAMRADWEERGVFEALKKSISKNKALEMLRNEAKWIEAQQPEPEKADS